MKYSFKGLCDNVYLFYYPVSSKKRAYSLMKAAHSNACKGGYELETSLLLGIKTNDIETQELILKIERK